MSETKRKDTTLTISFVDGISSDENMSKLIELIGAPDFESKVIESGWDITAPNGKTVKVSYTPIMEFIRDSMDGVVIEEATKNEYNFGSYANKDFIENKYFADGSNYKLYSRIGYLWTGTIEVKTTGEGVSKPALDRLHKKNVLALKDKIVAMKHVHSVEYTCTLKNIVESECSV